MNTFREKEKIFSNLRLTRCRMESTGGKFRMKNPSHCNHSSDKRVINEVKTQQRLKKTRKVKTLKDLRSKTVYSYFHKAIIVDKDGKNPEIEKKVVGMRLQKIKVSDTKKERKINNVGEKYGAQVGLG